MNIVTALLLASCLIMSVTSFLHLIWHMNRGDFDREDVCGK